ncbi:Asp-tRNA(Asn)/Glu-tRNA(Gln) amidotransferase subunit GatA [Schleiferilactobacillus shenzhenensis]|uniref:Glutamyl-tRNA(Gln) amidotransferase subunit A n=1 Tax=Schleiferilactobacillus shenzhenensis LY-73 TaxID=1231336 RepID=U4TLD8_9LACO|nr:Asp-tRNA(Asn)/Glu-tRNA(Gln) amidotransferase subunit GatA [Schleiferilactobacillus shenzhenensis]ERL64210.1 GatA [Schleiferilactobacillus shenzhenensis LY-73]
MSTNYFKEDISTLHDALVNKQTTAVQLTADTLAQIHAKEDKTKAFITVTDDEAKKQAAAADAAGISADQPLAGVPLALKDNIITDGVLTTAASKILTGFIPVYDATVTKRLKAAGSVLVGKTNLDEFAMGSSTENSYYGPTHNAWDLDRVPGGSSGGSAAAVAAGEVVAALGSDTGGSIRQPAAFNGIFGIKPTYGRVSRWGLIAFGSSLDQIGVLSRRVKDSALILQQIAGQDENDDTSLPDPVPDYVAAMAGGVQGMRLALPEEYLGEGVSQGVRDAIEKAVDTLKKLGATVDTVSLPHTKYAVPTYYLIASSEASSNLQRFDGIRYGYRAQDVKNLEDVYVRTRSEGFGDEVKRRIMLGTFSLSAGFYDAYFNKAAKVRHLIQDDFTKVFADHDLIIAPTTPTPAFKIGEKVDDPVTMYMNDILTIPANLAGIPAASVPAGLVDGLPVGLQLMAKPLGESTIFKAAAAFEDATKFYEQVPTAMKGEN